jgi:hypothetical protein
MNFNAIHRQEYMEGEHRYDVQHPFYLSAHNSLKCLISSQRLSIFLPILTIDYVKRARGNQNMKELLHFSDETKRPIHNDGCYDQDDAHTY